MPDDRIEPPIDSTDDLVDAYYDTGAYLTDPTRPGAVIEPPPDTRRCERSPLDGFCYTHVWLNMNGEPCPADEPPSTINGLRSEQG